MCKTLDFGLIWRILVFCLLVFNVLIAVEIKEATARNMPANLPPEPKDTCSFIHMASNVCCFFFYGLL